MNKKKQIRRIKTILHTLNFASFTKSIKEEINKRYEYHKSINFKISKYFMMERDRIFELKELIDETNISDNELMILYLKQKEFKNESHKLLKHITTVVRRDNKGVYIGSGYTEGFYPTVRYPSKKRSLKTWKKFYEMFPRYAERDNWDGKTSNKMK